MKKRPLQVALHVREPSVIEFNLGERVQLDQLTPSSRLPERHGSLLERGVSTRTLAQGHYCFKTLTDAHLRVVHGGVDAHEAPSGKTPDPEVTPGGVDTKGDEPAGELPTLTIA